MEQVMASQGVLYLTSADIEAAAVTPGEVIACVETGFAAHAAGRARTHPKLGLYGDGGNFYFTMAALSDELGYAITHMSEGVPLTKATDGHHFHSVEILSDAATASPVAILNAFWIATWLPAGVTAAAAKRLARPDSRIAGFVACGAQARVNLATLCEVLPIEAVYACDERPAAAEEFAAHARSTGLAAQVAGPRETVTASEVVVTSVPSKTDLAPFLEPAWLGAGAFVSMVDLARSWRPGLEALDRLATDDRMQAEHQARDGRLKFAGPYDSERAAIIHPGHIAGLLPLAGKVYEAARAKGLGTALPA